MKYLILFLTLVNVTTLVLCTSGPDGQPEIRKTSVRSPSPASAGTPALVNSLQSSQDAVAKVQSAQLYSRPATTADYNAIQSPHTSLFAQQYLGATGQHTSPTGHGSYLIALNSNGAQPTLMPTLLNNGATPVIMQYLPQNGNSNGIQYLQLIPTRPLIVPISPYLSSSPYNQYNSQYHGQPTQYSAQSSPFGSHPSSSPYGSHPSAAYSSPASSMYSNSPPNSAYTASSPNSAYTASSPNTHTLATAASSYANIPTSAYHPPTGPQSFAGYQPTLQSPIGGYSTNVYSYFRPQGGVQMISGPLDLSLNTNEYLPLQGESGYRMSRRP